MALRRAQLVAASSFYFIPRKQMSSKAARSRLANKCIAYSLYTIEITPSCVGISEAGVSEMFLCIGPTKSDPGEKMRASSPNFGLNSGFRRV